VGAEVSGSDRVRPTKREIQERLEVTRPLHAEILSSLTEGRMTASELTERIYGLTRDSEE